MIEPDKRALIGYALAALLIVVAGVWLLDRPGGPDRDAAPIALDGAAGTRSGSVSVGTTVKPDGARVGDDRGGHRLLYVHVAGAVRRPGLYRFRAPVRTAVAIARAGGPARGGDLDAVNLAVALEDGQQVIVPRRGDPRPASAAVAGETTDRAPGKGASPISLSSASPQQLETLDGIGPALAARIIDYREANGGFRSLDELREVEGIGDKRFEALQRAVRP